jgi:hypothetical protein
MNKTIEAALKYRELGLSVIPVGRNKKPLVKWEPFQKNRADETQIKAWFKKKEHANIGIVTGEISGITVVDSDSEQAYNLLNEFLPDTFSTPTAKTPKGKHFYFRYSPKFSNAVRLVSDIDIRNNGGYVVAPPSSNGIGKDYEWFNDLSITKVSPQPIPAMLLDILLQSNNNNSLDHLVYDETPSNSGQPQSNNSNVFTEGRRDNDIFRLANCLVRGGMPREEVCMYLENIANLCTPSFSKKEVLIKIDSAIKRSLDRSKVTTAEIKEWIKATSGTFSVTNYYFEQQLQHPKQKAQVRAIFSRLANQGVIEPSGNNDGIYQKVDGDVPSINLRAVVPGEFPIELPLGMSELAVIRGKNIIVVAGEKSSGKTCFCLNAAILNANRGKRIRYCTSEMGEQELIPRLKKFEPDIPYDDWLSIDFKPRTRNFHHLILPDDINIIDYLGVTDNFYKIAAYIDQIFEKLNKGIALIAIQKATGADFGRGGEFSIERARLYFTLSRNPPDGGIAKIIDAKEPRREDRHPKFYNCNYHTVRGSIMTLYGDWVPPKSKK